jgi:hypothetical protein
MIDVSSRPSVVTASRSPTVMLCWLPSSRISVASWTRLGAGGASCMISTHSRTQAWQIARSPGAAISRVVRSPSARAQNAQGRGVSWSLAMVRALRVSPGGHADRLGKHREGIEASYAAVGERWRRREMDDQGVDAATSAFAEDPCRARTHCGRGGSATSGRAPHERRDGRTDERAAVARARRGDPRRPHHTGGPLAHSTRRMEAR